MKLERIIATAVLAGTLMLGGCVKREYGEPTYVVGSVIEHQRVSGGMTFLPMGDSFLLLPEPDSYYVTIRAGGCTARYNDRELYDRTAVGQRVEATRVDVYALGKDGTRFPDGCELLHVTPTDGVRVEVAR
jgi:hypothetical protein